MISIPRASNNSPAPAPHAPPAQVEEGAVIDTLATSTGASTRAVSSGEPPESTVAAAWPAVSQASSAGNRKKKLILLGLASLGMIGVTVGLAVGLAHRTNASHAGVRVGTGAPPVANCTPAVQAVSVEGNHFTRDGVPWVPRAAMFRGLMTPTAYTVKYDRPLYETTLAYGPTELQAARAFGADAIRFLVGQPSIDPLSPKYSPSYLKTLKQGVELARCQGFVVQVGMQDEWRSGSKVFYPLANSATSRAWSVLNNFFGKDQGITFELYNEPGLNATPSNWQLWAHGGPVPAHGDAPAFTAVGMQTLINQLREEGAINTLVLDGLEGAQSLDGLPPINDTLQRIGYAVHPYPVGHAKTTADLDRLFGNVSKTKPVFADEWSAGSNSSLGLGHLKSYETAVQLVNYFREHKIGIGAGGFDVPGFMRQTVPGPLTNYNNYSSDRAGDNAGTLLYRAFTTNYSRELTMQDALCIGACPIFLTT